MPDVIMPYVPPPRHHSSATLMDAEGEGDLLDGEQLTVVIIGASGDLAKRKTFPALFELFIQCLLPKRISFVGYARTKYSQAAFHEHIRGFLKGPPEKVSKFLELVRYKNGIYDNDASYEELDKFLRKIEERAANRIIYLAIPPSIFEHVIRGADLKLRSRDGCWTRLIVEKPFGRDAESFHALNDCLTQRFSEDEIYRIDHYLGKELVQNVMVLRFGNRIFEPLWNSQYVESVTITFKEPFGVEGRAGYFDNFGIVRDVMQNHLLQIMTLVAMECPASWRADDIRDEKVKVLKCLCKIDYDDVVTGQYGRAVDGSKKGYTEDSEVPSDSLTPTFAMAVLKIDNARWQRVPFMLKCGKALNERKAEIRVQFKHAPPPLFPGLARNELVIIVQPNEAVYMKVMTKEPGLGMNLAQTELDFTYKNHFEQKMPEAYERLLFEVARGDHSLFVRGDELEQAWKTFTPLLEFLEDTKRKPEVYPYGARTLPSADELARRHGFERSQYSK